MNMPIQLALPRARQLRSGVDGIVLYFGLALALMLMALGWLAFLVSESRLTAEVDASLLRNRAHLLAPSSTGAAPDLPLVKSRITTRQERRTISDVGYRLLDPHGRPVAGTVRLLEGSGAATAGPARFQEGWGHIREGRALTAHLADGSRLDVVAESELVENMGHIVWPMFWVMLAVASIGGVAASVGLSRVIAGRLAATRQTADAIVAGDLSRRVPVDRLDGMFADQARSFNLMLDRIEQLMTRMRQMSSDVAHDLRTPITRLRATLETAAGPDCPPAERQARIDNALHECDGILSLFASLLRLSEVEAGRQRAALVMLDLSELVDEIAESMEPVLEDAGLTLKRGRTDLVRVRADRDLLSQLLVNLVDNAARYAGAGASVALSLASLEGENTARLRVADSGTGIAPKDRERVMRRFVRLGGGRTTSGNGLGLALVEAIARLHGGTVALGDNRPGLIVDVFLPLASVSQSNAARFSVAATSA